MGNKMDNVNFLNDCVASDLLDSHVLCNEKVGEAAMERSARSSLDANSVDIGEITESPDTEYMSTSAILHYCKSKILLPYLKLLTVMGLRPAGDTSNVSKCSIGLSHIHSVQIAVFMLFGYLLQYMACFRRDRGFCYKLVPLALASTFENENYRQVCYGSVTFTYIGPSILHFFGFMYALYLFRISDNEQLQNLMERVFLLSSYAPQGMPTSQPKRLLRTLWFFIILSIENRSRLEWAYVLLLLSGDSGSRRSGICLAILIYFLFSMILSILWMCLSLSTVNLMMARGPVMFKWMENSSDQTRAVLKVFLIVCTMTHDMVQATIITSYCLQAQLLQAHLMFLKERLVNRTTTPLNWMREIAEFRKLLKYLNEDLAPAVCLFTIVNVSWSASGLMWLLSLDRVDTETEPIPGISILTQLLWISASIVPFVQAARLTKECQRSQSVGHVLSVRPFLHQDTSHEDIITVLMYASTLKLRAKLFHCPIVGRYVYLVLALAVVIVFSLSMCHYL